MAALAIWFSFGMLKGTHRCVFDFPLCLSLTLNASIQTLAKELSESLFPKDSGEAFKMKTRVNFSKHIVISGGNWKNEVTAWLKNKGF
jgi:large subunit ribosomal protein L49